MNIEFFKKLLIDNKPHALTRYGDGERCIFDRVSCHRKGFKYDPENDGEFRLKLIESFNHKQKNYYVADKSTDISACLFVNENYPKFLNEYVPLFNFYDVIYVGHENSKIHNLPFKIHKFFPVKDEAWKHYPRLHLFILQELAKMKKPAIVLFASGPYSNILVYRLFRRNPKHIYLNIGSVFDPFVFDCNTRQYQKRVFKNDS